MAMPCNFLRKRCLLLSEKYNIWGQWKGTTTTNGISEFYLRKICVFFVKLLNNAHFMRNVIDFVSIMCYNLVTLRAEFVYFESAQYIRR